MPAPTYVVDVGLLQYATEAQKAAIEAVNKHGSMNAAAVALGQNKSTVRDAVMSVKRKAAIHGYSPEHAMTRPVPETHVAKGISTYYDKDGKVTGQWVKSSLDDEKAQAAKQAALVALAEDLPRLPPLPNAPACDSRLATVYTLTDAHVGAMAWHKEGGADWDLKIAEATLVGCFEKMVIASPAAAVGVVAQLGDFLHADGISAVTPTSGHLLDADGRFAKVVQVAVRLLRRVVDMALAKHERVVVLMAEGNHDITSSIWLRTMFAALYENEPRVQVIDSPLPYYCLQHGKTMLAWHHGHLKKNDQLPILFAAQFPQVWGSTTKRYAHTGHRHHVEEKEHSGMSVMQHTTLTARDAYAARGGWISDRAVTAVTYHDEFGKHSTVTICPEMLEAA
jgi:hypothetical protein